MQLLYLINQSYGSCFNAFRGVILVSLLISKSPELQTDVRMEKKGDLSNFECGMVVGARRATRVSMTKAGLVI